MRELMIVLKAVADKNRMRILKMLEKKSMCVCELAAVLGIKQPSVSKHLVILKNAGLVEDERNGQWIDYSLCRARINLYAPFIRDALKKWLNDDPVIAFDRNKATTLNRVDICKK
ncbi:MAG: winged helix-turn-helix transcriptional regulator [Deltaproteobacteria bacterium]|nr:winged helix-turn-helix transcriptional regulator [Deltaproteobacteria bacterium]